MPTPKPKKILVIEDDVAMREIVTHKLLSAGFEVTEAEDGKKALELFSKIMPDLVLLDLLLPEVDGFKVLETIRNDKDKQKSQVPVIVLSNLWSNQDILRAQSLRANAFMVKAYYTTEEILAKVKEIISKPQ